jgi:hypothetical protein
MEVTVTPTSPPHTPLPDGFNIPVEYVYAAVIALVAIAAVLLGYAYVKRTKK